jgi:chorismate-pyruvate lyase
MNDYFKSKGYLEGGILTNSQQQRIDMRALPSILRVLLVTDGTVTKTLEAYYWEPISVTEVDQHEVILAEDNEKLSASKGETLLKRSIKLMGENSGQCYAKADSLIRLQQLPKTIREKLISGEIGIGELLRESGLETYRKLIDIGEKETNTIYRSYQIIIDHMPAILVTEYFSTAVYQKSK